MSDDHYYRCFVDKSKSEREDHTQNISRIQLDVDTHVLTFINTPGKPSLFKNRICGITQADTALVVVEIDAGVTSHLIKTLEVLKTMGITSIVCAVTKLDKVQQPATDTLPQAQVRYMRLVTELGEKIPPSFKYVDFVPVSGKFPPLFLINSPQLSLEPI